MGDKDGDAAAKTQKASAAQEQPPPNSPATVFPDWASFQAYYNPAGTTPTPPPGFYHSPVASSPQGHPYMWGPQHMIPPYGTAPPPYVTMYPHGGLYPHPSIPLGSHLYSPYAMPSPNGTADASIAAVGGAEVDGKSAEGKERSPIKRTKGSLGSLNMITGKSNETGKVSGVSANCVVSQSSESGNEASSEGSDASSRDGSQQKQCHEQGVTQNGGASGVTQTSQTSTVLNHASIMAIPSSAITAPTTTLNIGMDYWGGPSSSPSAPIRSKLPVTPASTAVVPPRDGVPSDLWIQDERELKRQKRKQSNRESARRSRLRKQAECEELAQRVGMLKEENDGLREELTRLRGECDKLSSENASLTERLRKHRGEEPRADDVHSRSDNNSGNVNKKDATSKDS